MDIMWATLGVGVACFLICLLGVLIRSPGMTNAFHFGAFALVLGTAEWALCVALYMLAPAKLAAEQQVYENLCYRLELQAEGDTTLYDEIAEYNEYVATGKAMMTNRWVGCYWPKPIFRELEIIELDAAE